MSAYHPHLERAELEILEMYLQGLQPVEIAKRRGCGLRTTLEGLKRIAWKAGIGDARRRAWQRLFGCAIVEENGKKYVRSIYAELTDREMNVLILLASGLIPAEIADQLKDGCKAIERIIPILRNKLGLSVYATYAMIVVKALRLRLITLTADPARPEAIVETVT